MKLDPTQLFSVRTTFKISNEAEMFLDELTSKYDITQKELLLTLMIRYPDIQVNQNESDMKQSERQTKTKVLANQVLQFIEKRAEQLGTHRDTILEAMIFQAAKDEKSDSKAKLNKALELVDELWSETEKTVRNVSNALGSNHPISTRLNLIDTVLHNLSLSITSHLKYDSIIEADDLSDTGNATKVKETINDQTMTEISTGEEYLKIYKSKVANTSISLEKKIPSSRILGLIPKQKHRDIISQYPALHYWDFGIRASEYIEPNEIIWILTGETLYKGKVLTIIEDESGRIGDSIGWSRQFKQPWKRVTALTNVEKLLRTPVHLKPFIGGLRESIDKNFYRIQ